jgi:hypothetical protein
VENVEKTGRTGIEVHGASDWLAPAPAKKSKPIVATEPATKAKPSNSRQFQIEDGSDSSSNPFDDIGKTKGKRSRRCSRARTRRPARSYSTGDDDDDDNSDNSSDDDKILAAARAYAARERSSFQSRACSSTEDMDLCSTNCDSDDSSKK